MDLDKQRFRNEEMQAKLRGATKEVHDKENICKTLQQALDAAESKTTWLKAERAKEKKVTNKNLCRLEETLKRLGNERDMVRHAELYVCGTSPLSNRLEYCSNS